ncbi:MAG: hypothetical protein K2Y26_10880 [Gemmatimonadaceae bacterium]|uniref:hypothetical protein n=1 Tax=Gemmatimonas sp. UBA7669 TaxID=1946568 RepID=UPI0025C5FDF1|nr:hypothetical protein [Gemmatimonas sp. UBA7669]MBX9856024.1 hypothetical protein [Gemmatimonadaceae bacterium]
MRVPSRTRDILAGGVAALRIETHGRQLGEPCGSWQSGGYSRRKAVVGLDIVVLTVVVSRLHAGMRCGVVVRVCGGLELLVRSAIRRLALVRDAVRDRPARRPEDAQ